MEQTPTFKCIKDYLPLGAEVGHIIKMSPTSMAEFDEDERFKGWRKHFVPMTLEEELLAIKT